MNTMEKTTTVCCANGHSASEFCTLAKCSHASPICTQPDCDYSKLHNDCTYIKAESLVQRLMNKSLKIKNQEQELVIGALNRMIKDIERFKDQYLKELKQSPASPKLTEEEQKLHQMIAEGRWRSIKSKLVLCVVNAVEDKNEEEERLIAKQLRLSIETVVLEHCQNLNKLKKSLANPFVPKYPISLKIPCTLTPNTWRFVPSLSDGMSVQVLNTGTRIRVKSLIPRKVTAAIFCHSILPENTVKLRLLKSNFKKVSLGVRQKSGTTAPKSQLNNSILDRYTVGFEGKIESVSVAKGKCSFSYKEGDTIKMKYQNNQLSFVNINTGRKHAVEFNHRLECSYEFCVVMQQFGDEWEIVEND